MTYVDFWSDKVKENKSFAATRTQDTRASAPSRLSPEINYGNFVVHSRDYFTVNGFDESIGHYGGDDDDIYHRLKLSGLREINPYDSNEARQYSILHGDEERLLELEKPQRIKQKEAFNEIYNNIDFFAKNSNFLELQYIKKISKILSIYEKNISNS